MRIEPCYSFSITNYTLMPTFRVFFRCSSNFRKLIFVDTGLLPLSLMLFTAMVFPSLPTVSNLQDAVELAKEAINGHNSAHAIFELSNLGRGLKNSTFPNTQLPFTTSQQILHELDVLLKHQSSPASHCSTSRAHFLTPRLIALEHTT